MTVDLYVICRPLLIVQSVFLKELVLAVDDKVIDIQVFARTIVHLENDGCRKQNKEINNMQSTFSIGTLKVAFLLSY